MRTTTAVLVLAITSVLVVPTTAIASSQGQQTTCKNDGHKYILGKTATARGKTKATFVGTFQRFHPCGEDDGYFTTKHKTITLTLTSSSTIVVFRNELNPSENKTITAAQFPHAFTKNKEEPFYQFSGPRSSVNKLREHFVS